MIAPKNANFSASAVQYTQGMRYTWLLLRVSTLSRSLHVKNNRRSESLETNVDWICLLDVVTAGRFWVLRTSGFSERRRGATSAAAEPAVGDVDGGRGRCRAVGTEARISVAVIAAAAVAVGAVDGNRER